MSLFSQSPSRRAPRAIRVLSAVLSLSMCVSTSAFAGDKTEKPSDQGHKADPKAAPVAHYDAEVLVLHATNGDKGIDPRIGPMPELGKPPFSSYKSYELLKKVKLPLEREDAKNAKAPPTFELPNGRVLQTKLLDVLPEDTLKISASINQPGGKTFLPLLEVKAKLGQSFIVAGQGYKGGILVLVIRVTK